MGMSTRKRLRGGWVFLGQRAKFGAIYSQENGYTLDWRYDCGDTDNVPFNEIQLAEDIAEKCRQLCRKLGLVFGCIDLIVAKTGETIFLEINEGGQFLWKESLDPSMPMLDTFCRFLASRGQPNTLHKQKRITRDEFYQSERWLATLEEIKGRGS